MRNQLLMAILIGSALTCASCASLGGRDPIQVYVVGVEPLQGEGLELRMLVQLRVQNPNEVPIEYTGLYVAMEVEGKTLATGVSDAAGTVASFGESVISVPVTLSPFRVVRGAIGALGAERSGRIDYQLKGKLAGPGVRSVRFASKGELTLPQGVDRAAGD